MAHSVRAEVVPSTTLKLILRTYQSYHTFVDYLGEGVRAGWIVPQTVYTNATAGFQPQAPMRFIVNGQLGIRLSDAFTQNFEGLAESSTSVILNETGMKVASRILVGCVQIFLFMRLVT